MYWTVIQENPMCIGLLYRGIQSVLDCYTGESKVYWTVIQKEYVSVIGRNAMYIHKSTLIPIIYYYNSYHTYTVGSRAEKETLN